MKTSPVPDLFSEQATPTGPLTVFHSSLVEVENTGWQQLFEGFTSLKAITFSSSLEFLVSLASRFEDMEIVFGSERILSREHIALTQASELASGYSFSDALADQKLLTEALARWLGNQCC